MIGMHALHARKRFRHIALYLIFLPVLITGGISTAFAREAALQPVPEQSAPRAAGRMGNALQTPTCYTLTLSATGSGSVPAATPLNSTDCAPGQYIAGETITLTASPDPGNTVVGWTGTESNSSTTTTNTVIMPAADHTAAVQYATCYTLTLSHTGTGSDPSATPSSSPGCSAGQYVAGASITLIASPGGGFVVGSWNGTVDDTSTSTTNTAVMEAADRIVTVNYLACHTLTRSHTGNGSDPSASPTNSTGCSAGQYIVDESITLTASPGTGSIVGGWSGTSNNASTSTTNTLNMPDNDHSVSVIYVDLPGAFGKSSPANGVTAQPTSLTLSWSASSAATSYAYCYDTTNDNACTTWIGTGAATSDTISGLSENTTYYWHVRASNSSGNTYSDGSDTAFWSFSTGGKPAAFSKSSPADGATGQPLNLTLSWSASSAASGYEYCLAAAPSPCTGWTSTGTGTSASSGALSEYTTYTWHVRASNSFGTTYSNGSESASWSFTTGGKPGSFNKTGPANGALDQPTSLTLSWSASNAATSYAYCYDTTNDNACTTWINANTATSVPLSGLSQSTIYYWQVRATNIFGTTYAGGSETAYWSFTTSGPPGAFTKIAPANGATNQLPSLTLSWSASVNATSYAYCYDTSNNNNCNPYVSTGTATSVTIGGLKASTSYYWHVRAINAQGTTYSNASATAFWSFTTGPAPGAFGKSSPTNASTDQLLNLNLSWGTSSSADSYEYCFAAGTTCNNWTSAGTNTTVPVGPLAPSTTYAWHVRSVNVFGTTYAEGDPAAYWTFTTGGAPGAFSKTSPINAAVNQVLNLNLSWGTSSSAASYEYCFAAGATCSNWTNVGTATSVQVGPLAQSTTYTWHVRAVNPITMTYSNGSDTAFWSFTTGSAPSAFGKSGPADGAINQLLNLNLSWGTSSNATSYEYCIAAGTSCSNWISAGANTSVPVGPLTPFTTYAWHVRAVNLIATTYSDGSDTAFWSFTTGGVPSAFGKGGPANLATGLSLDLTLTWGTSLNAASYAYCIDTTNDNTCAPWANVGTATSAPLSGLTEYTTYYWHVRANNSFGTIYSDGASTAFWSFTTGGTPGAFGKSAPAAGATGQPLSLSLEWGPSTSADYYEYCYDNVDDNTCNNWTNTGTTTSASLSGLTEYTTYYWHVRATNSFGTTYSGGSSTAFFSFTTGGIPGSFGKTSPADLAVGQSLNPTLQWSASANAAGYWYCYATSTDACTNWLSAGTSTSIAIGTLSEYTTYYWHVRAANSFGITYSDGSSTAFRSFTTGGKPLAFSKSTPANAAVNQPLSLTLQWAVSTNAVSYEYCYDSSNDNNCTTWTSTGTASASISGLTHSTTYYWHVRANNSFGTTYSNGSPAVFWSFTTGSAPGTFNKTGPANGAAGQPLSLNLTWSASSNAASYEYCYATSTANCTNWTSTTLTSAPFSTTLEYTTYYWHVRANNSYGQTYSDGDTYFSFTTGGKPLAFSKNTPANAATGQPLSLSLTWSASSAAAYYEYCFALSAVSCTNWTSIGTSTSHPISGLDEYTTYFWHVRASNSFGTTYSNGSGTSSWSFTTGGVPGAFNKTGPADLATGLPLNPTLTWTTSANVTGYEYCYATSTVNCTNWTSTGTTTSAALNNLAEYTTYYWHVRANNSFGTTASDNSPTAFWSFTTGGKPLAFSKNTPANAATNQLLSLTLNWAASTNAAGYEYCYAASSSANCTTWINNGTSTSASLSNLFPSTTYYWHVRASNSFGTTYSNGSSTATWYFTTGPAPGAFAKSSPANGATGLPLNPTLTWTASSNATGYEYCYATSTGLCTTWLSSGASTSANLSGLAEYTTYYWHVRANNSFGQTYSDSSPTDFRSFTTGGKPLAFNKTSPDIGATGQPLSVTLTWEPSTAVEYYEYCLATSTTACSTGWTTAGTATSISTGILNQYTTYYWHVRAVNSFGTTYSGGALNAYRSFTTGGVPGAFTKSTPANGATNRPISLNLTWQASSTATNYEYCYDTTNDGACAPWVDAGNATTAAISGLTHSTTYYWHVRANNSFGQTYSNGNLSTAFWSFTTGPAPAAFSKTLPVNAATNQPLSLSLSWGAATGATSYEYCYDSTNDGACSNWITTLATSASIGGLTHTTTYYWQVRANNNYGTTYANGLETAYWSFATGPAPGAFSKTSPASGATSQLLSLSLGWEASPNAVSYDYCFDTSDDNNCTTWVNVGSATSATISNLVHSTTYYWQVRANNSYGTTYANAVSPTPFWSFTTGSKPGTFNKTSPSNGAGSQLLSLTLQWSSSTGVAYYEYCIDPSDANNTACNTGWNNVGTDTSVSISGLVHSTTYYWHVRAVNNYGITHANGADNAFWSFTTGAAPGAFNKSGPANGATGQPLSLTLQWGASSNATSYEYCYDTSNNNVCNTNWIDAGNVTSVIISGLNEYTNYYWHVRANNSFGQTYSNASSTAFRSFTTGGVPGAFNKTGPANAGSVFIAQPLNPILEWEPASGTPGTYEYCYDTTDDGTCTNWTSTGTTASAALSGLQPSTRYYWQVRAVNSFGATFANGSETTYWSFVTQGVCSGITAWKAEYWANIDLSGPAVLCRNDVNIDFEWGYLEPPGTPLNYDNFSVRWTRSLNFTTSGTYRFNLLHDDGARLYVDGVLKKDSWDTCCATESVNLFLSAGTHTIRLDMHEDTGAASAHLWWEQISQQVASIGSQDGWILESAENSSKGGSMSAASESFFLGDNALNRQYRTILSFNTAALPNEAVITSVTLKIKQAGLVGTNPFKTHGGILVDLRSGGFNSSTSLQTADFQAPSAQDAAMTLTNNPVSGWYSKSLGSAYFKYINLSGITQFRLRFNLDDNNDLGADYLKFYSGNYATSSYRPQLIIKYYIPAP